LTEALPFGSRLNDALNTDALNTSKDHDSEKVAFSLGHLALYPAAFPKSFAPSERTFW
jgi:hypothetical protein